MITTIYMIDRRKIGTRG